MLTTIITAYLPSSTVFETRPQPYQARCPGWRHLVINERLADFTLATKVIARLVSTVCLDFINLGCKKALLILANGGISASRKLLHYGLHKLWDYTISTTRSTMEYFAKPLSILCLMMWENIDGAAYVIVGSWLSGMSSDLSHTIYTFGLINFRLGCTTWLLPTVGATANPIVVDHIH